MQAWHRLFRSRCSGSLSCVAVALCTVAAPTPAAADLAYRIWTTDQGLPQGSVNAIAQTPDGYLWIATFDGLVRFDGVRMQVYLKSEIPEMTSNRCLSLLVDSRGALWVGTEDGGILRFHGTEVRAFGRTNQVASGQIGYFAEDKDGRILAEVPGGIAVFEGGQWRLAEEKALPRVALSIPADKPLPDPPGGLPRLASFQPMTTMARGRLWVMDATHLYRLDDHGWQTFSPPVPSLVSRVANAFFADREGGVWIGGPGGLVQATVTPVRAIVPDASVGDRNIYGVAQDSAGRIWATTWANPLLWEGGRLTQLVGRPWWPPLWVTTIEPDTDGSIIASGPQSVFKVWPYRGFERILDGVTPNDVLRDRRGTLWIASPGGLIRQRGSGWETVTGLPSNDVRVLLESGDGALWIGTYGGLARWADGHLQTWTSAHGLSGNSIRALHEDETGALWIGTYDSGLNRFAGGRFAPIRKRDGLFDDGAFVILDDGAGRYWMSSNRGVYSVARQELEAFASGAARRVTSRAWSSSDGMPSSECNGGRQPSGLRAADGALWFPTQRGLAVFDPRNLTANPVAPPVVVEEVATERRTIPLSEAVVLHPDERTIEVRYTANSFVRPDGIRFRYQLAGFDERWIEAGSRRFAQYAYIPPGQYTLKIVAANSDGVWNTEGVSLAIQVDPFWWQTMWFRGLASLVLVLVLGSAYRQRVSSLQRRQVEQETFARRLIESQEAERKRIASELHDGIGQALVVIRNRALLGLAERAEPDVLRQMEEISAIAADSIDDVRKVAYGLRPYQLDRLGLTRALEALVKQASESSAIPVETSIAAVEGVLAKADEINVYRIVQEAINNMIRHSHANRGRVVVDMRGGGLQIQVEDDGVGFDAASTTAGGLGLTGITERARILGGRATVRSATGKGTTLTVQIPGRTPGK